jgi:hypothetical protein
MKENDNICSVCEYHGKDKLKVIQDLAGLFPNVEHMEDLDATDYIDTADSIFRLVLRAREALSFFEDNRNN